jgi:uncharacterized protein (DUF2141 family)
VILARAGEARVAVDRTFGRADAVRVWTAVRNGDVPVHITVEIADANDRSVAARAAAVTPASFVVDRSGAAWTPDRLVAQVDVTMPLTNLRSGSYRIRVKATNGLEDEVEERPFTVV